MSLLDNDDILAAEPPQSRVEDVLTDIAGGSAEIEPPQSRVEKILHAINGATVELEEPQSRVEKLLMDIYQNGGSGGGSTILDALSVTENGTYIPETGHAYNKVNVAVPTEGGGGGSMPVNSVNFIDYDGTIVASYSADDFAQLTAMPDNPSHAGLVAQGWNWSLANAQTYVAKYGKLWIGQMYITQSGDTEIDVVFTDEARLDPTMTICVSGTITVNWGDDTAADTVTGTSLGTRQAVPHSYASTGSYTIKIHAVSGQFTFYGSTLTNPGYTPLRKNTVADQNYVYANTIQAVRLGDGITLVKDRGFAYCNSLASITIHDGVTSIESSAFSYCYSLASITIPDGVTSIGSKAFSNCNPLASITIPDGVTSIGSNAFANCFSLASITIPDGVTSIESSAFSNCYSLASITIPDGVTSIGSSAFGSCYGVAEYHFMSTTPPSLANVNGFMNIVSDCIMYVPYSEDHSILEAYKSATNWSRYASYMQEEAA